MNMEFIPIRTLKRDTQATLASLQKNGELVLTNNGQPVAYMVDL